MAANLPRLLPEYSQRNISLAFNILGILGQKTGYKILHIISYNFNCDFQKHPGRSLFSIGARRSLVSMDILIVFLIVSSVSSKIEMAISVGSESEKET